MRFHTTIVLHGKTATGIEVPAEVVAALGPGKRPPVRVTLNGYTYRTTVAVMGGAFLVPVSADVRNRSGVAAGDEVDVDIEPDTEPREVTLPADLRRALDEDPQASSFYDTLSYSHRSAYVSWIDSAKKDETRQRRVLDVVARLREGRNR